MKERRILLLAVTTLLMGARNIEAADGSSKVENLRNDSVYEEVTALQEDVINAIAEAYMEKKGEVLPEDFDIDLGDAYKVYIDGDFFSESTSETLASDQLSDVPIVWYYETRLDGNLFLIEISKGGAIDDSIEWTEEDHDYLESIEGKWHISGYGYNVENTPTYTEKLNKIDDSLIEDHPIYLVGGLKMIQYPVALITREDHPEALVPMEEILVINSNKNEVYNDMSHTNYKENQNPLEYENNSFGENVIDFEAMQQVAKSTELSDTTSAAGVIDLKYVNEEGVSSILLIGSTIGISVVVVLLVIVMKKRRVRA